VQDCYFTTDNHSLIIAEPTRLVQNHELSLKFRKT
jgi:hypothetical protein